MSESEFNISLGGGLYMDSNGNVQRGAFPAASTYTLPGGGILPITQEAFEKALTGTTKALQGIVKVLPDPNDPDSIKRFADLGLSTNLINLLGSFGEIAGKIAKMIPIIGAAVVVLQELINLFSSSGPSPLELMIKAQFADVQTHLRAMEMQGKLELVVGHRVTISNAMTDLREYIEEAMKFQPSLTELQRTRNDILGVKRDVAKAVESLLQYETWLFSYNPESFKHVLPWISDLLHFMPAGSPSSPRPAPTLPSYENRFEHGMMVPAVIHAVQSYLMLIKALTPEYRSTGKYDEELRKFAGFLENLTMSMRAETLTRTIYPQPGSIARHTFSANLGSSDVIDLGPMFPLSVAPSCARFPVGALDLCAHTDAFFQHERQKAIAAGADPWLSAPVLGSVHVRWTPPAVLERIPPPPPPRHPEHYPAVQTDPSYRITNPIMCTAAANAQSEVEYMNLLLTSGYLNLVQVTTLMRHLSTEPDRSETVKGQVILLRDTQEPKDVTVQSEDIVFSGIIESSARREPARCRAKVPLSTQPIREDRMLPYRIVLRTFRSILVPGHWRDVKYEDYYSAHYEKDLAPGRTGFLRMVTETKDPWVLDEKELWPANLTAYSLRTSPRELVQHSDEVELAAHTFDWYVPVPGLKGYGSVADTQAALRSVGWAGVKKPVPMQTFGGSIMTNLQHNSAISLADMVEITDSFTWRDGTPDWEGQQREAAEASVVIKYDLEWKADRLYISFENRPQDRNYIVFLVVEETLPASGQVLHTALPVPMNGQITYVPQKFFDDERAAVDKANRIVLDVATHYAESAPVGPEDPFIGRIHPGDLLSPASLQQIAGLAQTHQPILLQQALQSYQVSSALVKGDVPYSQGKLEEGMETF